MHMPQLKRGQGLFSFVEDETKMGTSTHPAHVPAADDFYDPSTSLPNKEVEFKTLTSSMSDEGKRRPEADACLPRALSSMKTPSLGDQDAKDSKILSLQQQCAKVDTCWEGVN